MSNTEGIERARQMRLQAKLQEVHNGGLELAIRVIEHYAEEEAETSCYEVLLDCRDAVKREVLR